MLAREEPKSRHMAGFSGQPQKSRTIAVTVGALAASTGMKVFENVKGRLFYPALAALSVLGMSAGYAAHSYAQDESCCREGAACCHPGSPCCGAHHESVSQR